jgi:hypothetical protein
MNPIFQVNFRREAWQADIARARRRVMVLGTWVTYFGALVVVLGLYGLNCAALTRRVDQMERQAQRLRQLQGAATDDRPTSADIALLERYAASPRTWRDRLSRLPEALPAGARIASVTFNPQAASGGPEGSALVLTGVLRAPSGQDRMRGVTALVETLRADTLFARGYPTIRLVSTRMSDTEPDLVEFTLECH